MIEMLFAALVIALVVVVVRYWTRRPAPPRPHARPPSPGRRVGPAPRPVDPPSKPGSGTDDVGGWLVGHEVAHGSAGFAGDPLPGGHLGSASSLAYWGGMFDEDEDEDDG